MTVSSTLNPDCRTQDQSSLNNHRETLLLSTPNRLTSAFPSAPCSLGDRSVAQLGSALDWGSRGRGFKSRRSDLSEVVLGIESSSDRGSVALARGGELLAEAMTSEPNRHAESLLPLIERLLAETNVQKQDIRAIAVGTGPGSFTGLRVGIALATGMGLGLGVPVVGISSLAILAHALLRRVTKLPAVDETPIAVCALLDARREETFFAAFDSSMELLVLPCLVPNATMTAFIESRLAGHRVMVAGALAPVLVPASLLEPLGSVETPKFPSAAEAALLAASEHACLDPLPFYLRDADAKLPNLPPNPLTSVD